MLNGRQLEMFQIRSGGALADDALSASSLSDDIGICLDSRRFSHNLAGCRCSDLEHPNPPLVSPYKGGVRGFVLRPIGNAQNQLWRGHACCVNFVEEQNTFRSECCSNRAFSNPSLVSSYNYKWGFGSLRCAP